MICHNCDFQNETGADVCANCGEALHARRILLYLHGYDDPIAIEDMQEVVLGRSAQSTDDHPSVDLEPFGAQDYGVSRRHAMIKRAGDSILIADLDSNNGTFVNGTRLKAQVRYALEDGDEVHLGQLALYVYFE